MLIPAAPKTYVHREAFCLMQYRDEVTGEVELLWNTRDGVTPFVITSRAGNPSQHVNWHQDRCDPGFVPEPGMRLFVDASPKHQHIIQSAKDYVKRYWLDRVSPMKRMWPDQEAAIAHFIAEWTKPGTPTVIEAE